VGARVGPAWHGLTVSLTAAVEMMSAVSPLRSSHMTSLLLLLLLLIRHLIVIITVSSTALQ